MHLDIIIIVCSCWFNILRIQNSQLSTNSCLLCSMAKSAGNNYKGTNGFDIVVCDWRFHPNTQHMHKQLLGRWDSQVYQSYVDSADMDRREWEETCSQTDEDPIGTNFNIFGNLSN